MLRRLAEALGQRARGSASGQNLPGELAGRAAAAEAALRSVRIPAYDVDVITSGVVVKLLLSRDGGNVTVFVDRSRLRAPVCGLRLYHEEAVWGRLVDDVKKALRGAGFREVRVYDVSRGVEC